MHLSINLIRNFLTTWNYLKNAKQVNDFPAKKSNCLPFYQRILTEILHDSESIHFSIMDW